jgi:hypothetical protein
LLFKPLCFPVFFLPFFRVLFASLFSVPFAFFVFTVRRAPFRVPLPLLPPADRLEAVAPEARVGRGLSLRPPFAP